MVGISINAMTTEVDCHLIPAPSRRPHCSRHHLSPLIIHEKSEIYASFARKKAQEVN